MAATQLWQRWLGCQRDGAGAAVAAAAARSATAPRRQGCHCRKCAATKTGRKCGERPSGGREEGHTGGRRLGPGRRARAWCMWQRSRGREGAGAFHRAGPCVGPAMALRGAAAELRAPCRLSHRGQAGRRRPSAPAAAARDWHGSSHCRQAAGWRLQLAAAVSRAAAPLQRAPGAGWRRPRARARPCAPLPPTQAMEAASVLPKEAGAGARAGLGPPAVQQSTAAAGRPVASHPVAARPNHAR